MVFSPAKVADSIHLEAAECLFSFSLVSSRQDDLLMAISITDWKFVRLDTQLRTGRHSKTAGNSISWFSSQHLSAWLESLNSLQEQRIFISMNLTAAMNWRYATKKFDPHRIVSEPLIDALLDAGNLAATSYGLQPYQLVVIQNQELQDKLVASSYGQRQVADASHVIVIATRTDVDAEYISNYIALVESLRDLEAGAMEEYKGVMIGTINGMTEEFRMEWAAKQAYLVLGTMLAACAMLEIDSCPMEGFVPSEYNELLDFNSRNLHAAVVLPVGYRAEDDVAQHQAKVRKPLSEMVVRI